MDHAGYTTRKRFALWNLERPVFVDGIDTPASRPGGVIERRHGLTDLARCLQRTSRPIGTMEKNGRSSVEFLCAILPWLCQAPGNGGGGGSPVPEPATLALISAGITVYGYKLFRRGRK